MAQHILVDEQRYRLIAIEDDDSRYCRDHDGNWIEVWYFVTNDREPTDWLH